MMGLDRINFQDPKVLRFFYGYGAVCFIGVAGVNLYNIIKGWNVALIQTKVNLILMGGFYLLLGIIFLGTYLSMRKKLKKPTDEIIEEIFDTP
jgi:hypothetical protein